MMHVIRDPGHTRPPDIVVEGRFTTPDLRRHSLVQFQVEPGHHQIHVRYSYTDRIDADQFLSGGNTLDIGLFDPRGTETGSMGFRGWSGSDQLEFVVGDEWATPPYTPGPILAGTWNLLLGPYKVGPRGCDWSVEIGFDRGIPPLERELVRAGEPRSPSLPEARAGWLRGDLHCHTRYSDGDSWPSEMLHAGAETGLDFLGVTDHNTIAHVAEYGAGGSGRPGSAPPPWTSGRRGAVWGSVSLRSAAAIRTSCDAASRTHVTRRRSGCRRRGSRRGQVRMPRRLSMRCELVGHSCRQDRTDPSSTSSRKGAGSRCRCGADPGGRSSFRTIRAQSVRRLLNPRTGQPPWPCRPRRPMSERSSWPRMASSKRLRARCGGLRMRDRTPSPARCRPRRRTLDHYERHDRGYEADGGSDDKRLVVSGDDGNCT